MFSNSFMKTEKQKVQKAVFKTPFEGFLAQLREPLDDDKYGGLQEILLFFEKSSDIPQDCLHQVKDLQEELFKILTKDDISVLSNTRSSLASEMALLSIDCLCKISSYCSEADMNHIVTSLVNYVVGNGMRKISEEQLLRLTVQLGSFISTRVSRETKKSVGSFEKIASILISSGLSSSDPQIRNSSMKLLTNIFKSHESIGTNIINSVQPYLSEILLDSKNDLDVYLLLLRSLVPYFTKEMLDEMLTTWISAFSSQNDNGILRRRLVMSISLLLVNGSALLASGMKPTLEKFTKELRNEQSNAESVTSSQVDHFLSKPYNEYLSAMIAAVSSLMASSAFIREDSSSFDFFSQLLYFVNFRPNEQGNSSCSHLPVNESNGPVEEAAEYDEFAAQYLQEYEDSMFEMYGQDGVGSNGNYLSGFSTSVDDYSWLSRLAALEALQQFFSSAINFSKVDRTVSFVNTAAFSQGLRLCISDENESVRSAVVSLLQSIFDSLRVMTIFSQSGDVFTYDTVSTVSHQLHSVLFDPQSGDYDSTNRTAKMLEGFVSTPPFGFIPGSSFSCPSLFKNNDAQKEGIKVELEDVSIASALGTLQDVVLNRLNPALEGRSSSYLDESDNAQLKQIKKVIESQDSRIDVEASELQTSLILPPVPFFPLVDMADNEDVSVLMAEAKTHCRWGAETTTVGAKSKNLNRKKGKSDFSSSTSCGQLAFSPVLLGHTPAASAISQLPAHVREYFDFHFNLNPITSVGDKTKRDLILSAAVPALSLLRDSVGLLLSLSVTSESNSSRSQLELDRRLLTLSVSLVPLMSTALAFLLDTNAGRASDEDKLALVECANRLFASCADALQRHGYEGPTEGITLLHSLLHLLRRSQRLQELRSHSRPEAIESVLLGLVTCLKLLVGWSREDPHLETIPLLSAYLRLMAVSLAASSLSSSSSSSEALSRIVSSIISMLEEDNLTSAQKEELLEALMSLVASLPLAEHTFASIKMIQSAQLWNFVSLKALLRGVSIHLQRLCGSVSAVELADTASMLNAIKPLVFACLSGLEGAAVSFSSTKLHFDVLSKEGNEFETFKLFTDSSTDSDDVDMSGQESPLVEKDIVVVLRMLSSLAVFLSLIQSDSVSQEFHEFSEQLLLNCCSAFTWSTSALQSPLILTTSDAAAEKVWDDNQDVGKLAVELGSSLLGLLHASSLLNHALSYSFNGKIPVLAFSEFWKWIQSTPFSSIHFSVISAISSGFLDTFLPSQFFLSSQSFGNNNSEESNGRKWRKKNNIDLSVNLSDIEKDPLAKLTRAALRPFIIPVAGLAIAPMESEEKNLNMEGNVDFECENETGDEHPASDIEVEQEDMCVDVDCQEDTDLEGTEISNLVKFDENGEIVLSTPVDSAILDQTRLSPLQNGLLLLTTVRWPNGSLLTVFDIMERTLLNPAFMSHIGDDYGLMLMSLSDKSKYAKKDEVRKLVESNPALFRNVPTIYSPSKHPSETPASDGSKNSSAPRNIHKDDNTIILDSQVYFRKRFLSLLDDCMLMFSFLEAPVLHALHHLHLRVGLHPTSAFISCARYIYSSAQILHPSESNNSNPSQNQKSEPKSHIQEKNGDKKSKNKNNNRNGLKGGRKVVLESALQDSSSALVLLGVICDGFRPLPIGEAELPPREPIKPHSKRGRTASHFPYQPSVSDIAIDESAAAMLLLKVYSLPSLPQQAKLAVLSVDPSIVLKFLRLGYLSSSSDIPPGKSINNNMQSTAASAVSMNGSNTGALDHSGRLELTQMPKELSFRGYIWLLNTLSPLLYSSEDSLSFGKEVCDLLENDSSDLHYRFKKVNTLGATREDSVLNCDSFDREMMKLILDNRMNILRVLCNPGALIGPSLQSGDVLQTILRFLSTPLNDFVRPAPTKHWLVDFVVHESPRTNVSNKESSDALESVVRIINTYALLWSMSPSLFPTHSSPTSTLCFSFTDLLLLLLNAVKPQPNFQRIIMRGSRIYTKISDQLTPFRRGWLIQLFRVALAGGCAGLNARIGCPPTIPVSIKLRDSDYSSSVVSAEVVPNELLDFASVVLALHDDKLKWFLPTDVVEAKNVRVVANSLGALVVEDTLDATVILAMTKYWQG